METTVWEATRLELQERFKDRPTWAEEQIAVTWLLSEAWDAFERVNLGLRGFSFRTSQSGSLLCVRAQDNGRAVVSFASGVHPCDCARIFYRLWCSDAVKWSDDKFA